MALPLFLGSVMCSCAPVVGVMLAGRFLAGVGIGAASNLVPLYIAEIAPEKFRGRVLHSSTSQLNMSRF